jgi:hypothetical protein
MKSVSHVMSTQIRSLASWVALLYHLRTLYIWCEIDKYIGGVHIS